MKLNRATIVGMTCAGALLLLPGTASAETLKGGTNQAGKEIGLTTGVDGSVEKARISWHGTCRFGGKVDGTSRFGAPFDRSSPTGFRSAATDDLTDGKYDVALKATIEGEAKGAGFKGTFKATLRYEKHGDYVTTCKTGKVKWSAQPR